MISLIQLLATEIANNGKSYKTLKSSCRMKSVHEDGYYIEMVPRQ